MRTATAWIAIVTAGCWLLATVLGLNDSAAVVFGFIPDRWSGMVLDGAAPAFLTPLTAALVHADILHLILNLIILLWCGSAVEAMVELGFSIIATQGTAEFLERAGLPVSAVNKVAQGRPHIVDRIRDGDVQLVFNTTEGWQSLKDSHSIRATALQRKVPYFTTAAASLAVARSLGTLKGRALEVHSLQSYYSASVN